MEKYNHWAKSLETGDEVIATIRHSHNGALNKSNVNVFVVGNNKRHQRIIALFNDEEYDIPYNELIKLA